MIGSSNNNLNLRALEIALSEKVDEIKNRNAEETSAVQRGLEVFHKIQLERDTKTAEIIDLERKLAVSENERDSYYREMVRYKRKAEHLERVNTAVLTQLSVLSEGISAAQRVAATHAYGDRPSTAKKITEVETGDVPGFLRGSPQKVS
jgi:hypothetical protein